MVIEATGKPNPDGKAGIGQGFTVWLQDKANGERTTGKASRSGESLNQGHGPSERNPALGGGLVGC